MVVQASDYGVWGDVLREQLTDAKTYRFGYQGQFAEKDEETGWSHFELREYDAFIGRWLVPDPARVHWTPYLAMNNSPVNTVDPDGGCETGNCDPKIGDIKDGLIFTNEGWTTLGEEVTVTSRKIDNKQLLNVDNKLRDFGKWLEKTFPMPKGAGLAFYSERGGGTQYHTRDGDVTGLITDPAAMLKTLQGSGNLFKNVSKKDLEKALTILTFLKNTQDAVGAYDALQGDAGAEKVMAILAEISKQVNPSKVQQAEQAWDSLGWSSGTRQWDIKDKKDSIGIRMWQYQNGKLVEVYKKFK